MGIGNDGEVPDDNMDMVSGVKNDKADANAKLDDSGNDKDVWNAESDVGMSAKTSSGEVIKKSVTGMQVGKLVKQFETGWKSTSEDSTKKTKTNRIKTPGSTLTPARKTTSSKKMTPGRRTKTVSRFDNSNDVFVIDKKTHFIVNDEEANIVNTPAKHMNFILFYFIYFNIKLLQLLFQLRRI